MASAPAKLTQAQKQTKLRSGIQPLQIMINTNYLAKSQFPLTSDLFEFPYLTGKPSNLEKYPLISTNVKYDKSRTRLLTHVEKYQIVFSMSALLQFIGNLPIQDDSKKDKVLKHNAEFILDMLFPVSYPVVKKVWVASNSEFAMSFGEAFEKEFAYDKFKFNTYLKLDGKSCTVDEVAYMDTFGKNPVYVKLYDLAKDFLAKRDAAIPVLSADIKIRLTEFDKAVKTKMDDSLRKITDEIVKIHNSNTSVDANTSTLKTEKTKCEKELEEIKKKLTSLQELEVKQIDLLRYNRGTGAGYVSVSNTIEHLKEHYRRINTAGRTPVIDIATTGIKATKTIETLNAFIKDLEKPIMSAKSKKTATTEDDNEILKSGYVKLINYIEKLIAVREAFSIESDKSIETFFVRIDKLQKLQETISNFKAEETEKNKECEKIQAQIDSSKQVDLSFIVNAPTTTAPTKNDIEAALKNPVKDGNFKQLPSLNTLVPDYIFMERTLLDGVHGAITSELNNNKNFEPIKNTIKSVYDSNEKYFSQRTPLTEAFMKLRKICGFAYLITTMHQQQENLNIEREYNINYNIDADLKKGEYLFHKTIAEALRAYYYPNRQSMEPKIKEMISVKDNQPINMEKIVTLFENEPNTPAAIDLVDLNGKPRYECQVTMILVGGIITPENSSKINCPYENQTIGAKISKKKFDLAISEFVDLTQQIEEIEKKYKIKYEKQKLSNINSGKSGGTNVPSVAAPAPAPAAAPAAAPAPKNKMRTVKESEVESIINSKIQSESKVSTNDLMKFINDNQYKDIKEFLETAIIISEVNPTDSLYSDKKQTYGDLYADKKIDASVKISSAIAKKNNEKSKPNISETEKGQIESDIIKLNALESIVNAIDAEKKKLKGGRKTKKCRQKRRKYARAKTQKRVH